MDAYEIFGRYCSDIKYKKYTQKNNWLQTKLLQEKIILLK